MAALAPASTATPGDESHLPKSTTWRQWLDREAWRKAIIAIPYLWLLFFFIAPFLIVLAISVGTAQVGIPPVVWSDSWPFGSFDNYLFLTQDDIYWQGYLNALKNAVIATFFALLIGYPMALGIARASSTWRNVLLLLVILPFWTSFLLRVYAWIGLLGNNSWFNRGLTSILATFFPFWVQGDHIQMMNTNFAVVLGIVYSYLPFMILPLYAAINRLSPDLIEASTDLGAGGWRTFRRVMLPLTLPGIAAGSIFVFVYSLGNFITPDLLGGGRTVMVGNLIYDQFLSARDWPFGAALAFILIGIMMALLTLQAFLINRARRMGTYD